MNSAWNFFLFIIIAGIYYYCCGHCKVCDCHGARHRDIISGIAESSVVAGRSESMHVCASPMSRSVCFALACLGRSVCFALAPMLRPSLHSPRKDGARTRKDDPCFARVSSEAVGVLSLLLACFLPPCKDEARTQEASIIIL